MLSLQEWIKSKEGILPFDSLREISREKDDSTVFFECPCGLSGHCGVRHFIEQGVSGYLSPVLNCYETGKQWLIRPIGIESVIRDEEERFFELLKRAETLVPKVIRERGYSPETLFFLKDTHGVPIDCVESILERGRV